MGCVGVARELTLVKGFSDCGGTNHTFTYLDRLDSGHIIHFIVFFVQQRVVPRNYYFCLYSNWTGGVIWI